MAHTIYHLKQSYFWAQLALLVALQVESIWKEWGGTDIHMVVAISIQKSLQKGKNIIWIFVASGNDFYSNPIWFTVDVYLLLLSF